jgi:glycosyltransferase involved in cell wall biosynthesis
MNKKTILYLISQSDSSGIHRHVFDLALSFKNEFNVIVAFGGKESENEELIKNLKKFGIKYHIIPYFRRSIRPIYDFLALIYTIKLIREIKPDIIHLNSSKMSVIGSLAGVISKIKITKFWPRTTRPEAKIIYTAHGWVFNELGFKRRVVYRWAERLTSCFKDKIICVSHHDYAFAVKKKIAPKKKMIVIHNGIAPINFLSREQAREKLFEINPNLKSSILNHKFLIGSIGHLFKTKSFQYFIEAISILRKSDVDIAAVVIGEGKERSYLEKMIKNKNLENIFFLAGAIPNAATLLHAFDIYVCSSIKEGLPYAILEAMSAGIPIVATEVGGNREVIKNEKTGILIEPANPKLLAVKIKELIDNKRAREMICRKEMKKVEKEFRLEKMIEETRRVYG